jgi:hydroxypyruvate isomerase
VSIQLSVCIEMIFTHQPFLERIDSVAQAGLSAFEFWDWPTKDVDRINERRQCHNLDVAAFIMEPRGSLVHADSPAELQDGVVRSLVTAQMLDCRNLIVLVGREIPQLSRQAQHHSIVRGLKQVAPLAEEAGVTLLIEPLNVIVDHEGFYLSSSREAFEIVQEVGSPNVKVLFDIYHQQVSEGNLIANITEHLDLIGYLHAADVPGRHEPGTGEINYANLLQQVSQAGYEGFLGLEYRPSVDSFQSIKAIADIVALVNRKERSA